MIDLEKRKEYIISQLGPDYLEAGKNELRYQCPNCMDIGKTYSDYKFYVNYGPEYKVGKHRRGNGRFFCQRCEFSGKINLDEMFESNSEVIDYLMNLSVVESDDSEDEEPELYMIPKQKPVPGTVAYDYIISRGITQEDIDFYDIRVPSLSDNNIFYGRFVIPNIVTSKIFTDMYVARSYLNSPVRYKNPKSSRKNEIVFNLHRIPEGIEELHINEGCINSIIAGTNSVATFGKYVSDTQLSLILAKSPKKIYVALDQDARKQALELCRRIKSRSPDMEVYLVELPPEVDASDLGRSKYLELARQARPYVSTAIFQLENFMNSLI